MTKEEKQLLLKDLCGRLPYGVKCVFHGKDGCIIPSTILRVDVENELVTIRPDMQKDKSPSYIHLIEHIEPYLRPMSSMTEEEKVKIREQAHRYDSEVLKNAFEEKKLDGTAITHYAADWCNENHFDYRGLIEKGLALEAPEDMYKTE